LYNAGFVIQENQKPTLLVAHCMPSSFAKKISSVLMADLRHAVMNGFLLC
jgi:hypothetical protein